MDRKETAEPKSDFANEREIDSGTARALGGRTGREAAQPAGMPRSTVTGAHDPGTGANETDGLSGTEEMTRRAAEDDAPSIADGDATEDDTPVFDRAGETHL